MAEYQALPRGQKLAYRLRRNPLLLFGLLPPLVFTVLYRMPFDTPADWQAERRSVWASNAALFVLWGLQVWAFGWLNVLVVQGLKKLFADEHFVTLLRAEGLDTLPKYLAERISNFEGARS